MGDFDHVHMTDDGDIEREWGRIRICTARVCIEWASRNKRAVDTVGGAAIGALMGAVIGSMAGKTGAGAAIGGLLGAGIAQSAYLGQWTGPMFGGYPLLEPRRG